MPTLFGLGVVPLFFREVSFLSCLLNLDISIMGGVNFTVKVFLHMMQMCVSYSFAYNLALKEKVSFETLHKGF